VFFPIMIVTCWQDHLHASSPQSGQQALEERLNIWWTELYREWGWERRETLKRGIFPNLDGRSPPKSTSPQPANRREAAPHGSSPNQPESSASSAASQAVVTPSEPSFNRYPVLPPLRPRDRNESPRRARSPSPMRGHRALGSISSAGSLEREREERRDGFNLPPLSSFRSREGSREPRPLAAPGKRWQGPSGGQLLGIEALVSAAEEHRRESLEQPSAMA
jgi:hypothetical protein